MDASGRPDESLAVEFVGPLQPSDEDGLKSGQLLSISLQKGQLRANVSFQQCRSAGLEVAYIEILGPVFEIRSIWFSAGIFLGYFYTRPKIKIEKHSFPISCLCGMYL